MVGSGPDGDSELSAGGTGAMNYAAAVEYLFGLQLFGVKLGLENMRRLTAALGHPERSLRFIHIAGTNGKGSTAALLDAALRAVGLRVGLYTSPHLCEVTERVQIGGRPVSEEVFAGAVERVRDEVERLRGDGVAVTFFEAMTGVALDLFRTHGVEMVVWETGLGGRLDATNVVEPVCSVITRIDRDHERWLGSTLGTIAGEKAGILKPCRPAVAVRSGTEPDAVLAARADELGVPLRWVEAAEPIGLIAAPGWGQRCRVEGVEWLIGLVGTHQRENLAVALAALEEMRKAGWDLPEPLVRDGMAKARWPGRFDRVRSEPPLILDGAHNPGAMRRLRETWREVYGNGPGRMIFGCLAEKASPELVTAFDEPGREVWLVPVKSGRAASVEEVVPLWRKAVVRVMASSEEAWTRDRTNPHSEGTLVAGSLYLVGDLLRLLNGSRDEVQMNG